MISEMSENDLKTLGHSVGFSPVLDNPRAARYNPVQAGAAGHGGATNLAAEFRPYYEVKSNYMIWYDYAVIKLNHLFESIDHIGLTQKLDVSLRLWLNCGTVNVQPVGLRT